MQFTSPDVNHGAQIIEPVVAADAAGASGSFSDAFGPARLHSALGGIESYARRGLFGLFEEAIV